MRLVFDREGTRHEVRVAQTSEHATLADLIGAATGSPVPTDETWWVDQTQHAADASIGEVVLLEGSLIARSRPDATEPLRGWCVLLGGGLHAGDAVRLPKSRPLIIGRSPQADVHVDSPSLSWTHVTLEREGDGVRVKDAGSTNGTYVDGVKIPDEGELVTTACVLTIGGSAVTLTPDTQESLAPPPGTLHNLTPARTAPFNRPPRPGRAVGPEDIRPPEHKEPASASRFSMATVVAPLVLAGVMVMMYGPQYALIALMSPVLAVGTWWEGKRRHKADVAEEKTRFGKALKSFEADIAEAADRARAQRREDVPDPATTIRRAALPTTRLWQRRRGDRGLPRPAHRDRRRAVEASGRQPACRPARGRGQGGRQGRTPARGASGGRPDRRRRDRHRRHSRRGAGRGSQPGLPSRRPLRSCRPDDRRLLRPRS